VPWGYGQAGFDVAPQHAGLECSIAQAGADGLCGVYQPVAVYDLIGAAVLLLMLVVVVRWISLLPGQLFGLWMAWYGLQRFVLDFLRSGDATLGPITWNQLSGLFARPAGGSGVVARAPPVRECAWAQSSPRSSPAVQSEGRERREPRRTPLLSFPHSRHHQTAPQDRRRHTKDGRFAMSTIQTESASSRNRLPCLRDQDRSEYMLAARGIAKTYTRGIWPRRRHVRVLNGAELTLGRGDRRLVGRTVPGSRL
jgi:hypothetical protein